MNATDIVEALHRRYNRPSQGREGERYICLSEARSGAGFDGNRGSCDFLAINTWQSRGMELIGHEIKVTRSDWASELANPDKAERFARFCRRWYVVVPTDLAAKIEHELPATWGMLTVSDKGRVLERHKPTVNKNPATLPPWWWVGWMAQIDRQHKRRLPGLVAEAAAAEVKAARGRANAEAEERYQYRIDKMTELNERVAELQAETGINLQHAYHTDIKRLGVLWRAARSVGDVGALVSMLRRAADGLEAATTDVTHDVLQSDGMDGDRP